MDNCKGWGIKIYTEKQEHTDSNPEQIRSSSCPQSLRLNFFATSEDMKSALNSAFSDTPIDQ